MVIRPNREEARFTALGLQSPWEVKTLDFDSATRRLPHGPGSPVPWAWEGSGFTLPFEARS